MITPHGGSQTQSWKQTFTFDRYGNRNFDEANTTFEGFDKLCNSNTELCADLRKKLNPAINASDNRISTGQGYSFDNAGNTIRDAGDRKFTYDAENKQVKVESLSPGTDTVTGTIGEYFYDGDGRRVKKYVPSTGEVTIFVYDAAGKLIAEYSTIVASTNDAKVAYLTNDHLGSPRINTDANGAVTARHDYHPFGEEIATPQRTAGLGYADDTVRKQFTGYEGDIESDLDFAEARYYASSLGRFTSVDPLYASAALEIPQSWNRYSYVMNNPFQFTDPSGMIWVRNGAGDTKWLTDDEWESESQQKDENGNPIWTPVKDLTFDSVTGNQVILNPEGPTKDNPSGWVFGDPNKGSNGVAMLGTAAVVSQLDGPEPFIADVIAVGFLAYAGYLAYTHEILQIPISSTLFMSTKDEQKSNPDKVAAAEEVVKTLSGVLDKLKSTPNKTPEIKKQIDTVRKAIKKAKDAMKKSEPHSIKGKRN